MQNRLRSHFSGYPDIIGWAYGRGTDWRRRLTPIIAETARSPR